MCFNAPVSLIASGGLAGLGFDALRRLKRHRLTLVAIVPLLFAIQQLAEGLQWIVIARGEPSLFLGYLFLLFAFLTWPTFIPLAVLVAEPNKKRKRLLCWILLIGIAGTAYGLIGLFLYPLSIAAIDHHIVYQTNIPHWTLGTYLYLGVLVVSCCISSYRFIRIFGALLAASFAVAMIFYTTAFISVWCFFAAILSGYIWWGLKRELR